MKRLRSILRVVTLLMLIILALPLAVSADDPDAAAAANAVAIDTVWTLIAAFLVFFMQAGFAMAERTKFSAYLLYSFFISAFIYPVVGHWIWGGGWLSSKGMIDFAGSTVVHSVGAISVHGVCGVWGTLAVGLFAESSYGIASGVGEVNGLFFGGGLGQFFTQLIGAISVFVWVFTIASVIFYIAKKTVGLRASDEEQLKGLDISEHGMESYAGFQIFTTE